MGKLTPTAIALVCAAHAAQADTRSEPTRWLLDLGYAYGWAPTKEQLAVILDTVEGLIHRLLVLPTLAEELQEAVPNRGSNASAKPGKPVVTVKDKIDAAPKDVRAMYDELSAKLDALGDDVSLHPQKHYMAFRRNRNFASVQIYNQKRVVRVYLNLDPDTVEIDAAMMRDVRQIGHFGTGDLEIALKTKKDLAKIDALTVAAIADSDRFSPNSLIKHGSRSGSASPMRLDQNQHKPPFFRICGMLVLCQSDAT